MNASKNSKLMNSLLPLNSGSWFTPKNSTNSASSWTNPFGTDTSTPTNTNSSVTSLPYTSVLVFLVIVGLCVVLIYYFKATLTDTWNNAKEVVTGYFNPKASPDAIVPEAADTESEHKEVTHPSEISNNPQASQNIMNKIMPGTGSEVFNISSNKYTYNDAEPLCKALGAELATYDQVKDAWNKGADWCNYGWVKGQMAVYPTSEETYQKIQGGPEEQRQSCGRPGLNGGYFDNPEMRFGVTCVGNKPLQNKHDEDAAYKGAPISPDALAFDKKVSQFKSEADHIAVLPFSHGKWTS